MLIHCDFCGGAFDSEKHATCPRCGAAWDKDAEADRVKKEEERRNQAERNAQSTEEFLQTANAVRHTANSVGHVVGGVLGIFRIIIFGAIFLALLAIAMIILKAVL